MTDQTTADDPRAAQAARRATVTVLGQPGTARLLRQAQIEVVGKVASAAYAQSIGSAVGAGGGYKIGVLDQVVKSIADAYAPRGLDAMLSPLTEGIVRSQQSLLVAAAATSALAAQAQQAVASILQTQDYARWTIGNNVAAAVASLDFAHRALGVQSAVAASLISRPWLTATAQIQEVLRGWTQSAQIENSLAFIGRTLTRLPLVAALAAHRAALRGDVQVVRGFILHWLGRTPTESLVEATITALLDGDWLPDGPLLIDDPDQVIAHLRSRTTDQHTRPYKMIGHTQIEGRRVASLQQPLPGPSGGVVLLGDLVPAVTTVEDEVLRHEVEDPRVHHALALLRPQERDVVMAWHEDITWAEAAQAVGLPDTFEESVRRKTKRVRDEVLRRLDASG